MTATHTPKPTPKQAHPIPPKRGPGRPRTAPGAGQGCSFRDPKTGAKCSAPHRAQGFCMRHYLWARQPKNLDAAADMVAGVRPGLVPTAPVSSPPAPADSGRVLESLSDSERAQLRAVCLLTGQDPSALVTGMLRDWLNGVLRGLNTDRLIKASTDAATDARVLAG